MRTFFPKLTVFTIMLIFSTKAFSQFSIKGPTCVVPGVPFQYNAIGKDTSSIKICVYGGRILEHDNTCYISPFISYTKLIWDSGIVHGTVSYHSNLGDTVLNVELTEKLAPGDIDTSSLFQLTSAGSIPSKIICSEAKGGNCSPSYLYQWQQSGNAENWVNIEGSNRKDLIFFATPLQTTYYRRRVLEEGSNTIDHSTIAIVVIQDR